MSQLTTNTTTIDELITLANNLPDAGSGEPELQEKTVSPATSAQSVTPDSGYDGLSKVTVNAMPTATQATPSISVSSAGLITASATQTAGYVAAGTKSATKQLTTQAAQTITPGTADKSIASGRYLTGTQTIKGDANLVAGNIKNGISIFGVSGTYEGDGGGSGVGSVETCTVTLDTSTAIASDGAALVWITVENGEIVVKNYYMSSAQILGLLPSIACIKGSSILLGEPTYTNITNRHFFSCTGGVQAISYDPNTVGCTFKVTGDGSITWTS